ncbi:MAG: restriction endonuclease [Syntrophales bacterium]
MTREEKITQLIAKIPGLSDYRLGLVQNMVRVFSQPWTIKRVSDSDIISESALLDFGDVLRIHHCFSREPFSKDKFEFALEAVLRASGVAAELAPRGRRGYGIKITGHNVSLKTEAAKAIRADILHISKFMELGGGQWGDDPNDLIRLRQQFLDNLAGIDRILVLRALRKGEPDYLYELVEIPKNLLEKASAGRFEMRTESTQYPKPGYCFVENAGELLFSLYFDGGGERKLQIKNLKKGLCKVHASWQFDSPQQNQDRELV